MAAWHMVLCVAMAYHRTRVRLQAPLPCVGPGLPLGAPALRCRCRSALCGQIRGTPVDPVDASINR
jgi:hypothetical protein